MGKKGVNDRKTFVRSQIPNQGILHKIGITINQQVYWKQNFLTLVGSGGGCIYKSLFFGHYMNCPPCDTPKFEKAVSHRQRLPQHQHHHQHQQQHQLLLKRHLQFFICQRHANQVDYTVHRSEFVSLWVTEWQGQGVIGLGSDKNQIGHCPMDGLESAKNWLVLWQFAHKRKDLSTPTFPWYAHV